MAAPDGSEAAARRLKLADDAVKGAHEAAERGEQLRRQAGRRARHADTTALLQSRALTRHDRAAHQQLAAPGTPGLPALQRAGQAGNPGLASLHLAFACSTSRGDSAKNTSRVLRARKIQADRECGVRPYHRELVRPEDLPNPAGPADEADLDLPDA